MRTFFFPLIFLLSTLTLAEEVRIEKILDANLFLLENGHKIKLAFVETPSLDSADSSFNDLAKRIIKYARNNFLGVPLLMVIVSDTTLAKDVLPVRLYRKFPLETLCYNIVYLERGFGKYLPVAKQKDAEDFIKAERKAKNELRGIWNDRYRVGSGANLSSQVSFYAEYLNNNENDKQDYYYGLSFTFINMNLRNNGFEIRGGVLSRREKGVGCCDCSEFVLTPYDHTSMKNFIILAGLLNWDYFGFRIGLSFFHTTRGYCSENPFPVLVLPVFGIKLGRLDRLYFNFDFLRDELLLPYSLGITWLPRHLPMEIWSGVSMNEAFSNQAYGLMFTYKFKRFRLHGDAVYYFRNKHYALRIGFGLPLSI